MLLGMPFGRIMPNPPGGFALAADRLQLARLYRGIAATPPIVTAWFNGLCTSIRLTGAGSA